MTVVLLLLLSAFEFPGQTGRSSAMLAGAAVPDWQHSLSFNPALSMNAGRVDGGVAYSRPYGLPGLEWGRACVGWSSARLGAGAGLSLLSLDRYHEYDAQTVIGGMPARNVAVGLGVHALVVEAGQNCSDFAPALDAGVSWGSGRLRLGAAGLRLNAPRWRNGTELPLRAVLAGSWQPVDEVLLALDLSRERSDEDAAFGAEFRLVPQLGLRFGVGTAPLRFGAGLAAKVGPVGLDYAYQFHPVLKESHVFGLRAAWH